MWSLLIYLKFSKFLGTMGVGQGYALAAALYCRDHSPKTKVLCVQGDSAFGFSGMELETIARYCSAQTKWTFVCCKNGERGRKVCIVLLPFFPAGSFPYTRIFLFEYNRKAFFNSRSVTSFGLCEFKKNVFYIKIYIYVSLLVLLGASTKPPTWPRIN